MLLLLLRRRRWGRNGEAGAECPFLMGALGVAQTEGVQRGDGREKRFVQVAATIKHFAANSLEDTPRGIGRTNFDANVSDYLLSDYYFPPFHASITKADAKGVMCALNAIRGRPSCLSPLLKAAREAWGFTGYVTSDTGGVSDFDNSKDPRFRKSAQQASCLAIVDGGCDIDSGNTYYTSLLNATAAGLCSMADVDKAVFNSLRVRFELGLFDKTADQPLWRLGQGDIGTAASAALNLRAAEESLVLLSNPKGVLPLRPGIGRLLVVGPHANATRDLIQVATGRLCPSGDMSCVVSPFDRIAEINRGNDNK
jgi:beta-glucosidase-like glycosyl hydrolase